MKIFGADEPDPARGGGVLGPGPRRAGRPDRGVLPLAAAPGRAQPGFPPGESSEANWSYHLTSGHSPPYGGRHAAAADQPPLRARRGLRPGAGRGRRRRDRRGRVAAQRAPAGRGARGVSARPCARRCSGWPRPGCSRCGTEARPRSATSSATPGSTCCRSCSSAGARSTPRRPQHPRGPARGRAERRCPRRRARRPDRWRPSDRHPRRAGGGRRRPTADVERQLHALEFWDQVVDAADSLVFRLMFNSLRAAYEPALEALAAADGRGGRPGRRPTACSPPRSAPATPRPPAPPPSGCSARPPTT